MPIQLAADEILAGDPHPSLEPIGRSRQGREIGGRVYGRGPLAVSLIAGCHADEPVGPDLLARLAAHLERLDADSPALAGATWFVVPHVNPDGAARNRAWARRRRAVSAAGGAPDRGFEIASYLRHAVREPPGDDVEFGFPRSPGDRGARPENRAVAAFLRPGSPFALHASFHGMGFAPGPWFLLEASWAGRTRALRRSLRRRARALGYPPWDVDRGGEKGFHRIDEGFSTRPDSRAMREHFLARGDRRTARRFRPSSMELVRSLGGDPLTFVTENPLFLLPPGGEDVRSRLEARAAATGPRAAARLARRLGVRPMPIGDQMRLQLAFLNEALKAVTRHPPPGSG